MVVPRRLANVWGVVVLGWGRDRRDNWCDHDRCRKGATIAQNMAPDRVTGGVIAALGPLVQVLLGIRWSNYSNNHDSRSTIIVYAIGLAVAVGLPFLREWVVRGREKSDGDGALRP